MYGSSGGDVVGRLSVAPAVDGIVTPANITTVDAQRLNVQATLERDDDRDGYGDESQDLCPGNPTRANQGCSGMTFGSTFLTPPGPVDFTSCATACVQLHDLLAGQPSRAPISGVVVRWRVRSFTAPQRFRLRIARAGDAGQVTMRGTSAGISQSGDGTDPVTHVEDVRLPIAAGDHIGFDVPGGQIGLYPRPGIGRRAFLLSAPPDGASDVLHFGSTNGDLQYSADVEADADHDGYGDETQDLCPTEAAIYLTACPPPSRPPPPPPLPSTPAPPAPPTVTSLTVRPTAFALSARRRPAGAPRVSYVASAAGSVRFVLSRQRPGRLSATGRCAAPTGRNRGRRPCVRWSPVASFSTLAMAGRNSFALEDKVRRRLLVPARYRMQATLTTATNAPATPVSARFLVRR